MAAIFLLTKVQEPQTPAQREGLETSLRSEFSDAWHDLGNGSYLVVASKPLITQEVTALVGITGESFNGAMGSYIVTNLDSYHGWAKKSTWEWIKTMKERDGQS